MRWDSLAAAVLIVSSFAWGCRSAGRACPEPESYSKTRLADWTGAKNFDVGLVAQAPVSCPGRSHPVIEAKHPRADAWLHVVETNASDPDTKQAPWVFIDVSPSDRKRRIPFYSKGTEFWDNPDWGRPKNTLLWEGYAYPVLIRPDGIIPIGGIRWGFEWDPAHETPMALPVTMVPPSKWAEHAVLLRHKFSGSTFLVPDHP